jgi:agmatinase
MVDYRFTNFLDLPAELSDPEKSGVIVLPLPLDISGSWKRGTGDGPAALIEASRHIEYYDEELGDEPCVRVGGIFTHNAVDLPTDPAAAVERVEQVAASLVRKGRLMVALGGEHSISFPLVKAHRRLWPDLCVLQIDAHTDMRESYRESPYNHACPMRRIAELGIPVISVGVRSTDASELDLIRSGKAQVFFAYELAGRVEAAIPDILASLRRENVYVTVDLDGLDPSVIPAVGTPLPGGLGWYDTLLLLRAVAESRNIVGADVVELCPQPGLHYAELAAAKLVYKLIAYQARLWTRGGE